MNNHDNEVGCLGSGCFRRRRAGDENLNKELCSEWPYHGNRSVKSCQIATVSGLIAARFTKARVVS